jgi:hypothetical protein
VDGGHAFTSMLCTSATSDIMVDINRESPGYLFLKKINFFFIKYFFAESSIEDLNNTTFTNGTIKCIPQKGDWMGNEEVVLIMSDSTKGNGISKSIFLIHE